MSDTIEKTILANEDARYRALQDGDAATLDRLLHDGVMIIHSTGGTDGKAGFLANVKSGVLKYLRIERTGMRVVTFGDTVAHVVGRVVMDCELRGKEITIDNTIVAVWIRDGANWKLASAQSTPTPK